MGEHMRVEKPCEVCGNTYYGVTWSRFCPSCKAARDAEKRREARIRYKQKIWAETHMTAGGAAIAETNAKAREAGMTYGMYEARAREAKRGGWNILTLLSENDWKYIQSALSRMETVTIERRFAPTGVRVQVSTTPASHPWTVAMIITVTATFMGGQWRQHFESVAQARRAIKEWNGYG